MNDTPIRFRSEIIHDRGFIKRLKAADVVMAVPTSPEWNPQVAFGSHVLRRIEKTGKVEELGVLRLIVNWESDEPEALCAALIVTKGSCDILSNGLTP
jgi:hypothetical protein